MRVKATRQGWYGGFREVGEVFEISEEVHPKTHSVTVIDKETGEETPREIRHPKAGKVKAFSERWMVEVKDEPIQKKEKPDAKNTLSGLQKGERTEPVI